jgi:membrane associated rhomboid family serine protease
MSLIYPWTFLTTTFIENNIFTFGISGVAIWHGGKYLERAWTSKEFAKFVVIVALLPNVLTFVAHITLYALTGNLSWR